MKKTFLSAMLVTLILLTLCALISCSGASAVIYPNSDKYTAGNTELSDRIENLEVDWSSGKVNVKLHSKDTVIVSEKDDSDTSDDLRVHWWLEDTTLHVKFCESGKGVKFFRAGQKELTVTVPESLLLSDVSINSASADVDAEKIKVKSLSISTASGEIEVNCEAEEMKLNSASGKIEVEQTGSVNSISAKSASGKINAILEKADEADFSTASGKIEVTANEIKSISSTSASGSIIYDLLEVPSKCKANSVSGKVTLKLPEDAGFTLKVDTVSGTFDSDFALKKSGNYYVCGDGDAKIDINTASGNVKVISK